jgi:hypothetical protein
MLIFFMSGNSDQWRKIANNNKNDLTEDWHLPRDNIYFLDDYKPQRAQKLMCYICGKKDIYTFPIERDLADVTCRYCETRGGMWEK